MQAIGSFNNDPSTVFSNDNDCQPNNATLFTVHNPQEKQTRPNNEQSFVVFDF